MLEINGMFHSDERANSSERLAIINVCVANNRASKFMHHKKGKIFKEKLASSHSEILAFLLAKIRRMEEEKYKRYEHSQLL